MNDDIDDAIASWREGPRGRGRPTINDVAQIARVSKKTVSRVINDSEAVKTLTKERVKRIIEALGYQPDPQARGLANRYAYLIGLLFDNPNPEYTLSIQEGILEALGPTEFELVVHACDRQDPQLQSKLDRFIQRQRLYGVIIAPPMSEDQAIVGLVRRTGTRLVRIAASSHGAPQEEVVTDDASGGREAASHLAGLGHRQIGFLSGKPEFLSSRVRLEGFRHGLAEHDIELPSKWIFRGDYTFHSGVTAGQRLLSQPDRPTALFAANDEMAAGVIEAFRQRGKSIPGDLSVVGYDDFKTATRMAPRLTTVHAPTREVGALAAAMILDLGEDWAQEHTTPQPWLVIRESTAPCSAGSVLSGSEVARGASSVARSPDP